MHLPFFLVDVTPRTTDQVVAAVLEAIGSHHGLVIGNLNLHGVYVYHQDPLFQQYTREADLVLVDGAPLIWAAGRRAGLTGAHRVGSTDWVERLLPHFGGHSVLAVGGTPRSSRGTETHMNAAYPAVGWRGVDGFDGARELSVEDIAAADLILVGMGMPNQERWIMDRRDLLEGKVVANVGGLIDYYSGEQSLAPRWLGRWGVEWVYRLLNDPRRLWHRYLVEPVLLLALLGRVRRASRRAAAESRR